MSGREVAASRRPDTSGSDPMTHQDPGRQPDRSDLPTNRLVRSSNTPGKVVASLVFPANPSLAGGLVFPLVRGHMRGGVSTTLGGWTRFRVGVMVELELPRTLRDPGRGPRHSKTRNQTYR